MTVVVIGKMNETLILLISNAITGVAGWFVGKKKTNAETDNVILDGLSKSIGLYQIIITDLKNEIHELNQKVDSLEKKVDFLTKENKKLKSSMIDDIKLTPPK